MSLDLTELSSRLTALDERIEQLKAANSGDRKAKPIELKPPTRFCPACNSEMETGTVSVHGTFWGFLLVGWSYQHVWFKGAGDKEEIVVRSGRAKIGYRCPACGFTGVAPGRDFPVPAPVGHV